MALIPTGEEAGAIPGWAAEAGSVTEELRSLRAVAEKAADVPHNAAVYSPATVQEDRTAPNQAAIIKRVRAPQTCAATEQEPNAPLRENAQAAKPCELRTGQRNLPLREVQPASVRTAEMPWHPDKLQVHGQRPAPREAAVNTERARVRQRNRVCRLITASNSAMQRAAVR